MALHEGMGWKKTARIILPVFIALLIIAGLFLPARYAGSQMPQARNGVLDLASWNGKQAFAVKGQWEFYWDRPLDDVQIWDDETPVFVDAPGKWSQYVINGAKLPEKGKATYRIRITGAQTDEVYGVRIKDMRNVYRLYADGILIAQNGNFGDDSSAPASDYRPQLTYFTPKADTFELVMQVSNSTYGNGGMLEPIILGTYAQVLTFDRQLSNAVTYAMTVQLISCLFFLIFFLVQRGEKEALIMSFLAAVILLRLSIIGDTLYTIFPNITAVWLLRFYLLCTPWAEFLLLYLHGLTASEAALYQEHIMQEPMIQGIIACQQENGWIGRGLHGGLDTQEGATKYLAEKAVDRETPVLKLAMEAFARIPIDDWCYDTRGKLIDEFKATGHGHNLIRCACIARAGYDDVIDISPQVRLSLDCFRRVLEVDSVLDITHTVRGGKLLVFNDNERWPCRYHLDILAHTSSWKNEDNIRMIADSVAKLMKTDRPELVNLVPLSWVGHPVGPLGAFPAQGLTVKSTTLLPSPMSIPYRGRPEVYQLEYIEWFARCGIVKYVPALREAVEDIIRYVDDEGICHAPVLELKDWGPYCGFRLETDWRSKTRKACDITFRALLIQHYADL